MRQEKKVKDRPAIALVLFFCLAALVAVFAVTSTVNKVRDNLQIDKAAEVVKKKAVSKTSENTACRGRRQPGQQKFRQQLVCQLYKASFWRSDPKIFHGYANLLGNSGSVHDSRRH